MIMSFVAALHVDFLRVPQPVSWKARGLLCWPSNAAAACFKVNACPRLTHSLTPFSSALQHVLSVCPFPRISRHVYCSSSAENQNMQAEAPPAAKTANKASLEGNVYAYLLDHTREPDILRSLRAETAQLFPQAAHMAVSPEQGSFLAWLVSALGCRRILEVGVFTGYSSLAMALALPSDGLLVACDRDPKAMEVAQRYWDVAGVRSIVVPRVGPALETLETMVNEGETESFDFAFVDADKRGYKKYYETLMKVGMVWWLKSRIAGCRFF
jgi:O-methyltransferase